MKKIFELRNKKKGFTLVEIIVVLVILALLAAATIPAMIGFINEADARSLVSVARTAATGAQAMLTEGGVKAKESTGADTFSDLPTAPGIRIVFGAATATAAAVGGDLEFRGSADAVSVGNKIAAQMSSDVKEGDVIIIAVDEDGKLAGLTYWSAESKNYATISNTFNETSFGALDTEPEEIVVPVATPST